MTERKDAFVGYIHTYPDEPYLGSDPPCIEKITENKIRDRYHSWAVGLVMYLSRVRRLPHKGVLDHLQRWNEKNWPPFEERELKQVVEDMAPRVLEACSIFRKLCNRQMCALSGPFYRCMNCDTLISSKEPAPRCPKCGWKVFYKPRTNRVRRVKAI